MEPCEFCQTSGEACIKTWGTRTQELLLKGPATPIDEVIAPEDVTLLQYVYSDTFGHLWGSKVHRILRKFAVLFQPSINRLSLRRAILAYSAAFAPNSSYADVERYSGLACQLLLRKPSTTLDEGDLFAACLLAFLSAMYDNPPEFRFYLHRFIAIMKDLGQQSGEKQMHFVLFWSLARDLITDSSRNVAGVNDLVLDFCQVSRPLIRQGNGFHQSTRAMEEVYGYGQRYWPFVDSVNHSYFLLRRSLWKTICNIELGIVFDPAIKSALLEVQVDRDIESKGDEIEAAFHYRTLSEDMTNTILTRLLHRVCKLLIAILEDQTVLTGSPSPRTIAAATGVMQFIRSEHLDVSFEELVAAGTVAQWTVAQFLPRILFIARFGLGDTTCPECNFQLMQS
jgi:hypothetical protein